jgi:hypothetical protein
MRNRILISVIPCLIFFISSCLPKPFPLPEYPTQAMKDSYVMVGMLKSPNNQSNFISSFGTGVIIGHQNDKTHILTAKHVIKTSKSNDHLFKILIWINNSTVGIIAKREVIDKNLDAAVISISRIDKTPIPISNRNPMLQEEVFIFGTPDLHTMKILRRRINLFVSSNKLELDQTTELGFSGGGIYSSRNKLLGICVSRRRYNDIGLCIPINAIRKLIDPYIN